MRCQQTDDAAPFEPGRPPTEDQLSAYLSLHAFMALLWSRNLINGYDYAIWQFRSAFEQDIDDEKELVYESATASLWAIHAGSRLWQNVVDPPKLDRFEQADDLAGMRQQSVLFPFLQLPAYRLARRPDHPRHQGLRILALKLAALGDSGSLVRGDAEQQFRKAR